MNFNPMEHYHNREQFPPEELEKYYGKHVAWSLDGTRIVASSDEPDQLIDAVRAAGCDSENVVLSYVEQPDVSYIGGLYACDLEDEGESSLYGGQG